MPFSISYTHMNGRLQLQQKNCLFFFYLGITYIFLRNWSVHILHKKSSVEDIFFNKFVVVFFLQKICWPHIIQAKNHVSSWYYSNDSEKKSMLNIKWASTFSIMSKNFIFSTTELSILFFIHQFLIRHFNELFHKLFLQGSEWKESTHTHGTCGYFHIENFMHCM